MVLLGYDEEAHAFRSGLHGQLVATVRKHQRVLLTSYWGGSVGIGPVRSRPREILCVAKVAGSALRRLYANALQCSPLQAFALTGGHEISRYLGSARHRPTVLFCPRIPAELDPRWPSSSLLQEWRRGMSWEAVSGHFQGWSSQVGPH